MSTLTLEDWRAIPVEEVAGLYDRECRRWLAIGWDRRQACQVVETARASLRLPGVVARDAQGRIVGWTYFLLQEQTLQIGTLSGEDAGTLGRLLAAAWRTPEGRLARSCSCFLFPAGPAVEKVLSRFGFAVERHLYLTLGLAGPPDRPIPPLHGHGLTLQSWAAGDLDGCARVLAAAYEGMPEARCFAPTGSADEWTRYVAQLVQTPACGCFDPSMSATVRTKAGQLVGLVIATALADHTAHIAQVVVAPACRRLGIGEALVQATSARARRARYDRITLLVHESNGPARRLYARLGFESSARFLFADRRAQATPKRDRE